MTKYNITSFYYSKEFEHTFEMFMELIKRDEFINKQVGPHHIFGRKKKKGSFNTAIKLLIESYVQKNKHRLNKQLPIESLGVEKEVEEIKEEISNVAS